VSKDAPAPRYQCCYQLAYSVVQPIHYVPGFALLQALYGGGLVALLYPGGGGSK
jgi:hypothetical protein